MKSYKNWKLVNESLFPLGISQPNTVGGLQSPFLHSETKSKKMDDEEMDHDECHCKKHMKDGSKKDQFWDGDKNPVADHSGKLQGGFPHSKKKKMTKKMGDEMMMMKKKPMPHPDDEDEDMLDMPDHDDDMDDDVMGDDDMGDDVGDDVEDDDMSDDVGEDDTDDIGDDDDYEAKKFGFMKKKMQKAMKKKMRESKEFYKDISKYPDIPADHSQDTEKEFFKSLERQFGNPQQRFSSGLSEDLLIPLTDPNAPAYQPAEPQPGEVGYAPQGRIGELGSYASESSDDYNVLKKYLGEKNARKLLENK